MLSALSTASIRVLVINKDGLGCPSKLWFIDHLDSALSTASIRVLVINKDGLGCPSSPGYRSFGLSTLHSLYQSAGDQ